MNFNALYNNQIIQGDCRKTIKRITPNSVDLIILDPPYNTTKEQWDKHDIIDVVFSINLLRIAKPSCSLYVWCGIGEKTRSLIRWFNVFNNHWIFKDLVTWKKQRGIGMRKGWLYTREECMWFVKDNKQFVWNKEHQYTDERRVYTPNPAACHSEFKRITNVWTDINESTLQGAMGQVEFKGHFTPKPERAIERIVLAHTKEGDLVFDPFMGSGTTGVVCKRTGRNFLGIEIDEAYCEMATKRIEAVGEE